MDKYLVYGNPIAQSRSPFIHLQFAKQSRQSIEYQTCLSTEQDFCHDVKAFIEQGGKGANVTAPFKEQAMKLCDSLSAGAKAAGAVNTLLFKDGKIFGDNTDGIGLVADLRNQHVLLRNKRILLMGAGGAARGVILPLLAEQPEQLTLVNRTPSKAQFLADMFADSRLDVIDYQQTQNQHFDLIINATSASLTAHLPPLSSQCIRQNTVCYDMVYGATLSPFLVWCEQQGANKVIDGLGMLVGQAAASFKLWRNVDVTQQIVLSELRQQLQGAS